MEGVVCEQVFVVMIKHLIDFDGNNNFPDGYDLYSIKMNIKDRTTVCVSITSEKLILNEQNQGEVY